MRMQNAACPNFNHTHRNAPVRFCPSCGGVVNAKLRVVACEQAVHAKSRRNREAFCVACGEQLIT